MADWFGVRWLRRRAIGDDRGANLVEFALISIPFLMITLGLVDFGRAIFATGSFVNSFATATGDAMGALIQRNGFASDQDVMLA